MSDEHLLRRIMILGNELSELKQDVILHRDLATKMHKHNIHLRKLLRECNEIMPVCPRCKGNLRTWERIAYNETIRIGHADGCEWTEIIEVKNET